MGIIATPGVKVDWTAVQPEDVGISGDIVTRLQAAFEGGEFQGLHALLIVRNGQLALERYFEGVDERWGQPLGPVCHGPVTLHDVRSITKSITGLLYGIALREDLVPPTSAKLLNILPFEPGIVDLLLKRRISIGHVLSMRMGLEWHEDLSYDNPQNGEFLMEGAADRYRFILGLPMADRPGTTWNYCGAATALLGHIIERGTDMRLEEFARTKLFEPLGIGVHEWISGSDGRASASSGLRFTARDLARIGQMLIDRGKWNHRHVVPASWITTSMKPRADVESGLRYGYQWWLGELLSSGKSWYAAYGNGGQRLIVLPSLNMIVVVLAGNYNMADQWKMPLKLMSRIVMPAVLNS